MSTRNADAPLATLVTLCFGSGTFRMETPDISSRAGNPEAPARDGLDDYGRTPNFADHNWLLLTDPSTGKIPPGCVNPVRFDTNSCGRGLSVG